MAAGRDISASRRGRTSGHPATLIESLEPRRLLSGSTGPIDVIVDSSASTGVQIIGNWYHNNTSPYGYLGNFLADTVVANSSNTPGNPNSPLSVIFTPTLPVAGVYQLYVHLIKGTYNAAAPFKVVSAAGTTDLTVNEVQATTNWYEFGSFNFNAGTGGSVTITDAGLAVGSLISADAIRFVDDEAVVNFAQNQGPATHRASGFLASYGGALPSASPPLTADPPASLVNPLSPQMFRTDTASGSWNPSANTATGAINAYASMSSYTNLIQLNLSNEWGYPSSASQYPGYNQSETNAWISMIQGIINQVNTTAPAPGVAPAGATAYQWDIWNEPNYVNYFPQGNISQFYATWQAACNTLRTYAPGAAIVGPSAGWDPVWIENFLTWTAQNNCVPDIISFHPFGDQNYSGGEEAIQYSSDISTLKTWIAGWNLANPATPINTTQFSINEYTNLPDEFNPGAAVWAMTDLENAQVASASHASWTDPAGVDPTGASTAEFSNYSLDGLLVPASSMASRNQQPRATWWAYDYYGAVTGELVQVSSGAGSIRGVAGYDLSKHTFNIVLGRDLGTAVPGMTDTLPLVLTNMTSPGIFREGETVGVQADLVPSATVAGAALASPTLTVNTAARIVNGQITINLPNWGPTDVYGITISRLAVPVWLSPGSSATWNDTTQTLTLTGAATIIADPGTDEPIILGNNASDQLTINPTSGTLIHLGGLNLSGGAVATVESLSGGRSGGNYRLLMVGTPGTGSGTVLSIDAASSLDLGDNDMIIYGGSLSTITAELQSGFNLGRGYWNGPGIVSSTAAKDASFLTTMGVTQPTGTSTFDGQSVSSTDVLLKSTYYGDANLDGKVDGSDYSRLDNGYLTHSHGWFNGDFNFDGVVNGSDYTLIDNAFNRQGASLAAIVAGVTNTISPANSPRIGRKNPREQSIAQHPNFSDAAVPVAFANPGSDCYELMMQQKDVLDALALRAAFVPSTVP